MSDMKYFLHKLFIFVSIFVVILFFICIANKHGINRAMHDRVFCFDNNITTIIAGDSHTKTSLNPEILIKSVNISEGAENYIFTYYKLCHFLRINPHINNIILGFSYHNISKVFLESLLKDISYCDSYYLILDDSGKCLLDTSSMSYFQAKLEYDVGIPFNINKNNLGFKAVFTKHMSPADYPFYGSFYSSRKSNINDKDLNNTIARHYFDTKHQYAGTSGLNIIYLNKIIEMCADNNINVYLFTAPLHQKYIEKIPQKAISNYNKVKADLLRRYNNIEFIDLSHLNLKDNCMGDGDHVNFFGATMVSFEVQKQIDQSVNCTYPDQGEPHANKIK